MRILRIGFVLLTVVLGGVIADAILDNRGVSPTLLVGFTFAFIQCYGQITGWERFWPRRRVEPLAVRGVGEWRKDRTLS